MHSLFLISHAPFFGLLCLIQERFDDRVFVDGDIEDVTKRGVEEDGATGNLTRYKDCRTSEWSRIT